MPRWNFTAGKYGSNEASSTLNQNEIPGAGYIHGIRNEAGRYESVPSKSLTRHQIRGKLGEILCRRLREGKGQKDGKSRRGRQSSEKLGCTNISFVAVFIFPLSSLTSHSFVFVHRVSPLYFAFSPSVFDFLPFRNLEKTIFFCLRVVLLPFDLASPRWATFNLFHVFSPIKRFVSLERRKKTVDFLFYSFVSMEASIPCFPF